MHNARAPFIEGRAVQEPGSPSRDRCIDVFGGGGVRVCQRVSVERASDLHPPNNRPCKDGRHEILADCRAKEGASSSSSLPPPPRRNGATSSSSSRAKQGFCRSPQRRRLRHRRAVPLVCHMRRKGTNPEHRVLAGGPGREEGPLQWGGRGSRADWGTMCTYRTNNAANGVSLPVIDTHPSPLSPLPPPSAEYIVPFHSLPGTKASCNQLAKIQQSGRGRERGRALHRGALL